MATIHHALPEDRLAHRIIPMSYLTGAHDERMFRFCVWQHLGRLRDISLGGLPRASYRIEALAYSDNGEVSVLLVARPRTSHPLE